MLEEQKIDKLIDLTKRAISVNANLLEEEKRFVEALTEHRDFSYLKTTSDRINVLIRKETLYTQAAQMLLEAATVNFTS